MVTPDPVGTDRDVYELTIRRRRRTDCTTGSADELVAQIYLPERKGSLQPEIIAAVRRYDRVPYRIEPALPALLAELRAGRPVLILQNLGLRSLPRWHYAVVIGYSATADFRTHAAVEQQNLVVL